MQIFKILFIFQKHFFIFFSSSLFLNGKQETLEDIADSIANLLCKSAVFKSHTVNIVPSETNKAKIKTGTAYKLSRLLNANYSILHFRRSYHFQEKVGSCWKSIAYGMKSQF
jgi:hypothetical protein